MLRTFGFMRVAGLVSCARVRHPLPYTAAGALFAFSAIAITRSSLAAIIDADGWPAYGFRAAAVADNSPCRSLNEISNSYLPSKAISQLSLLLAKEAAGKRVYFFWYGVFNQQIVEYYTAQNEVKPVIEVPLRSEDDSKYWFWTFNPELVTTRSSFREFLNYLFARADFIVIPERLEAFQIMWASPITGYHEEIAAALNSREVAPDYEVWAVVDEGPSTRVLILRRRPSHAPDSGLEHFPRTWGSSDQIIGRGFKGAIEVTQRPWWEDDAATPPRLLYAYNGYNLIRLGRLYIADSARSRPDGHYPGTDWRCPSTAFTEIHRRTRHLSIEESRRCLRGCERHSEAGYVGRHRVTFPLT